MMEHSDSSALFVDVFVGIMVSGGQPVGCGLAFCVPKFAGNHRPQQIAPRGKQTRISGQGKKTRNFHQSPQSEQFVAIPH
jgi:hypothetical protein